MTSILVHTFKTKPEFYRRYFNNRHGLLAWLACIAASGRDDKPIRIRVPDDILIHIINFLPLLQEFQCIQQQVHFLYQGYMEHVCCMLLPDNTSLYYLRVDRLPKYCPYSIFILLRKVICDPLPGQQWCFKRFQRAGAWFDSIMDFFRVLQFHSYKNTILSVDTGFFPKLYVPYPTQAIHAQWRLAFLQHWQALDVLKSDSYTIQDFAVGKNYF